MNDLYQVNEVIRSLTQIISTHGVDLKVKIEANKKLIEVIKQIKINN